MQGKTCRHAEKANKSAGEDLQTSREGQSVCRGRLADMQSRSISLREKKGYRHAERANKSAKEGLQYSASPVCLDMAVKAAA